MMGENDNMHYYPMFLPAYSRLNYPELYSQVTVPMILIGQLAGGYDV